MQRLWWLVLALLAVPTAIAACNAEKRTPPPFLRELSPVPEQGAEEGFPGTQTVWSPSLPGETPMAPLTSPVPGRWLDLQVEPAVLYLFPGTSVTVPWRLEGQGFSSPVRITFLVDPDQPGGLTVASEPGEVLPPAGGHVRIEAKSDAPFGPQKLILVAVGDGASDTVALPVVVLSPMSVRVEADLPQAALGPGVQLEIPVRVEPVGPEATSQEIELRVSAEGAARSLVRFEWLDSPRGRPPFTVRLRVTWAGPFQAENRGVQYERASGLKIEARRQGKTVGEAFLCLGNLPPPRKRGLLEALFGLFLLVFVLPVGLISAVITGFTLGAATWPVFLIGAMFSQPVLAPTASLGRAAAVSMEAFQATFKAFLQPFGSLTIVREGRTFTVQCVPATFHDIALSVPVTDIQASFGQTVTIPVLILGTTGEPLKVQLQTEGYPYATLRPYEGVTPFEAQLELRMPGPGRGQPGTDRLLLTARDEHGHLHQVAFRVRVNPQLAALEPSVAVLTAGSPWTLRLNVYPAFEYATLHLGAPSGVPGPFSATLVPLDTSQPPYAFALQVPPLQPGVQEVNFPVTVRTSEGETRSGGVGLRVIVLRGDSLLVTGIQPGDMFTLFPPAEGAWSQPLAEVRAYSLGTPIVNLRVQATGLPPNTTLRVEPYALNRWNLILQGNGPLPPGRYPVEVTFTATGIEPTILSFTFEVPPPPTPAP